MKGAVVALISTAFAVLGMVAAPTAANAAAGDRVLTIHYYRPAADYAGWNVWGWDFMGDGQHDFDNTAGVPNVDCAGVKISFTITDPTATAVTAGLFRSTNDWATATKDGGDNANLPEIALNASGNTDVYFTQGVNATTGPTIATERPARRVIVHYKRTAGDYAGWNFWAWGPTAPDANGASIAFDSITPDATGSITSTYTIPTSACGETSREFLLRKSVGANDWVAKDGGDNANVTMTIGQGDTEIWLKQGVNATTHPSQSAAYIKDAQTIGAVGTTVKVGKTLTLPAKSSAKVVIKWTSTTTKICTVASGKVKGVKAGACKLKGVAAASAAVTAVTVNKSVTVKK